MGDQPDDNSSQESLGKVNQDVTWGRKLFFGALVAVLVFFYWLLIYAGGVTVHHG